MYVVIFMARVECFEPHWYITVWGHNTMVHRTSPPPPKKTYIPTFVQDSPMQVLEQLAAGDWDGVWSVFWTQLDIIRGFIQGDLSLVSYGIDTR